MTGDLAFAQVDGRRVRIVRTEGQQGAPEVVLEAGSFGQADDWAVVQADLARRGIGALAYDRAGLGFSDPAEGPRDSAAIAAELERLLEVVSLDGPIIYVGHSMAGLHARVFVARNVGRVRGVGLIDAVTPEAARRPGGRVAAGGYQALARAWAGAAALGALGPLARFGDTIGLPEGPAARKRAAFANPIHNRWAAAEVGAWGRSRRLAAAAAAFPAELPCLAITAGPAGPDSTWVRAAQAPALRAAEGRAVHVPGARHATLLGERHAPGVADAVAELCAAASRT